jgi:hypothetical protein
MRVFGALILGVFTGLAISYTGPLDWGFAVNAAAPAVQNVQSVDRTNKGDRLDRAATRVGKEKEPTPAPKLLIGCEPLASPLSATVQARIPGRCAA